MVWPLVVSHFPAPMRPELEGPFGELKKRVFAFFFFNKSSIIAFCFTCKEEEGEGGGERGGGGEKEKEKICKNEKS